MFFMHVAPVKKKLDAKRKLLPGKPAFGMGKKRRLCVCVCVVCVGRTVVGMGMGAVFSTMIKNKLSVWEKCSYA